ncbi:MAG: AAA family ATPase [Candidatus Sulfopaludibacter sp.]|nr:AAA family ATPase [Candidatus Sulfopaludibacter sp.]
MYNAFFGFTQNPFNMSPDPAFLYRSVQHEEALANLIYGVQSRKGFILLTGEVGTGKTTMLECLRDFLSAQQIAFASLFNSRLSVDQFFEMLSYDLDLRCNRHSKTEVLLSLNGMLLERASAGRTTVLIVDEAHNLEWDVLEEIRLLGNMENRRGKLLQIILAGQQELDRKMEAPEFRQLKQRIALRCTLRGFDFAETAAYINSRMARAGAGTREQTIIPVPIIKEIQRRSQGIPRLINAICDNLLLTAFAMETKTASLEMLDEVTGDMRLDYSQEPAFPVDDGFAGRSFRRTRVP